MPTRFGKDSEGCFARWGKSGKKYYYACGDEAAAKRAKAKADRQGAAAYAHGYKNSKGGAMKRYYQTIVSNVKLIVRNDKMHDRDYSVAPGVLIKEGVLNGNRGPIFYPGEELAKLPQTWNNKPVVVYHPDYDTACTPSELEVRGIGFMMNTKYNKAKKTLNTEAWLEPDRVKVVDARVAEAVKNQTTLEWSTGLYMDVEETVGEYNGKTYVGIARNLRPDHVAILPDQVGACSVEDGGGFIRLNQQFVSNELSYEDLRQQMYALLDGDAYVEDVYDSHFIYDKGGNLYDQEYEVGDDKLKLVGVPTQVIKVTSYEPLTTNKDEGDEMDKKAIVDKLIAHKTSPYSEEDREGLMALNESTLERVAAGTKKEPEKKDEPALNPTQNAEPTKKDGPATLDEYISKAPPELQGVLRDSVATHNQQRKELVEKIVANENNEFAEDYLLTKDLHELRAIAKLADKATPSANGDSRFTNNCDFSGRAPVAVANAKDEAPLQMRDAGWKK